MLIHRRSLLLGLGSLLAAPAIVHAQNIMPVRLMLPDYGWESFNEHPEGMMYQWVSSLVYDGYGSGNNHFVECNANGWHPVPASLYKNKFPVKGSTIEYGGCVLMQKPREPVRSAAYPWPEVFRGDGAVTIPDKAEVERLARPEELRGFERRLEGFKR